MIKLCEQCDLEFEYKRSTARYCSTKCKQHDYEVARSNTRWQVQQMLTQTYWMLPPRSRMPYIQELRERSSTEPKIKRALNNWYENRSLPPWYDDETNADCARYHGICHVNKKIADRKEVKMTPRKVAKRVQEIKEGIAKNPNSLSSRALQAMLSAKGK